MGTLFFIHRKENLFVECMYSNIIHVIKIMIKMRKLKDSIFIGLPAVITLTPYGPDITTDDVPIPEACRRLEEAGAAVVGLNCGRGPETMLPLLREVRKVCKVTTAIMN